MFTINNEEVEPVVVINTNDEVSVDTRIEEDAKTSTPPPPAPGSRTVVVAQPDEQTHLVAAAIAGMGGIVIGAILPWFSVSTLLFTVNDFGFGSGLWAIKLASSVFFAVVAVCIAVAWRANPEVGFAMSVSAGAIASALSFLVMVGFADGSGSSLGVSTSLELGLPLAFVSGVVAFGAGLIGVHSEANR